jgi:hypothetical protein
MANYLLGQVSAARIFKVESGNLGTYGLKSKPSMIANNKLESLFGKTFVNCR